MNKEKIPKKKIKEQKKAKNPIGMFFKLGDKVTKGDPKRKADFDYYMLWVMFLAFFSIFISSIITGIKLVQANEIWQALRSFGWAFIMIAILWFQFFALKQTWITRNNMRNLSMITDNKPKEDLPFEEDSVEDMMKEFPDEGGEGK